MKAERRLGAKSLLFDSLRNTLVERSAERKEILDCYDRCCSGKPTALIVSGPSGVGKKHLIESTLKDRVKSDRGAFLVGSFDVLKQPEPYHAFRDALQGHQGAAEFFRSSTKEAQSAGGRLAFVTFIRRISKAGIVVLVLNDLENANTCSLTVLKRVLTDLEQCSHILVILTTSSPDNVQVELPNSAHTIFVHPLTESMVDAFLLKAWSLQNAEQRQKLAALLHNQTKGNMFLCVESLMLWVEGNCVSLDGDIVVVDLPRVDDLRVTNPTELLSSRLQSSHDFSVTSEMLRRASCFGRSVRIVDLEEASPGDLSIGAALATTLIYLDKRSVFFSHSMIQRAVYDSMRLDEKEQVHLSIGRRLWRRLTEEDDSLLFTVLQQMRMSKRLVTNPGERHALARLCLRAARVSASVSAFHTASDLLELGIGFLGDDVWRDDYDFALEYHNLTAEVYLCATDLKAADRVIDVVLQEARSDCDCYHAETTRLYSLGVSAHQNEAIDMGMDLLQRRGETFPKRNLKFNSFIQLVRVHNLVKGRSDASLLSLPPMQDAEKLHCMQILNLIFMHAMLVRPSLTIFISLKFVELTLRYGLSLMAPQAFTLYGWTLSMFGRFEEAYRFGSIGVALLDRLGHDQSLPRVYAAFYGMIYPLHRPMSEVQDKFLEGQRVGLLTGDYEFSSMNAAMYLYTACDSFVPLSTINDEFLRIRSEMKALGQETTLRIILPVSQAVQNLMGKTDSPLSSCGDVFDFEGAYLYCVSNDLKQLSTGISMQRTILCCIFNDFKEAFTHNERCFRSLRTLSSVEDVAIALSFASVIYLENGRNSSFLAKTKAKRTARRTVAFLKVPSLNCPDNFLAKKMLVQAELDAFCGRQKRSLQKFYCAIKTSRSFLWGSFCRERAARYLLRCGRLEEAKTYFEEARQCCIEWGATAKVDQLEQEICELFLEEKN